MYCFLGEVHDGPWLQGHGKGEGVGGGCGPSCAEYEAKITSK